MTADAPDTTLPDASLRAGKPRRNLAQRLLSGAAWAFGAKIIGVASGLAINAFLARMLSPEQMGAPYPPPAIVLLEEASNATLPSPSRENAGFGK